MTSPSLPPTYDIAVIGAGPAGSHAALAAAGHGKSVCLIDEGRAAGGQVWRAPAQNLTFADRARASEEIRAGDALRARLAASGVDHIAGSLVWNITEGFVLHLSGADGTQTVRARRLVVATGTTERLVPFEGWTTPGVVGLAGATALLKEHKIAPGRRTALAGAGPLLFAAAHQVLEAGGEVAAIVDLNGRADWARRAGAMALRPGLALTGLKWIANLRRRGVPILSRHAVLRAHGDAALTGIDIVPVDDRWTPGQSTRHIACDALAIGHGLIPATEILRLLGAETIFDRQTGVWRPVLDGNGSTSLDDVFVAGDGAGVEGAQAAALSGERAGHAAAGAPLQGRSSRRAARFGKAMASLTDLRPGLVDAIPQSAVICRCEGLTRAAIEAAAEIGEVGQLKGWTRAGMGPCQGRYCERISAELLARKGVDQEAFGAARPRPPLRPVRIGDITGTFDPADIALPPSLPSS